MMRSLWRGIFPLLLTLLSAVSVFAATTTAPVPPAEGYPLQNYLTGIAEQQWRDRAVQLAKIKTADDVRKRIEIIRAEFLRAIGGLPQEKTPLNARVTGTLERQGYRIEKVIY